MSRREKMAPILDRIPPVWGKFLDFPEDWDDAILELDARLAEIDPDYVLHQAKVKFGGLRYYFHTDTGRGEEMAELVHQAAVALAGLPSRGESP